MSDTSSSSPSPNRVQLAAYAAPAISIAAIGLPVTVYLPDFYHTELGMDLSLVGLIFLIARFWDLAIDPAGGAIIDGTRNRLGDRRWLALSLPILCFGAWLVFFVGETATATSILAGLVVMYIGFTLNVVSHLSWGASLGADGRKRASVQAWREAALVLGLACVLATPALIELSGLGDRADGIRAMGFFVVVGAPAAAAIALIFGPKAQPREARPPNWRAAPALLYRNNRLRYVLGVDLIAGVCTGFVGTTFIMFARSILELEAASNLLLLAYFISGMAGVPLWLILAKRTGLPRALQAALLYGVFALLVLAMAPPGAVGAGLAMFVVAGLGYGAPAFLLRAATADLAADHRDETGEDMSGVFFGLLLLTNKLGLALAVGVSLMLLESAGFSGELGPDNSPEALTMLRVVFIAIPCLLYLIATGLALALERRSSPKEA